LARKASTIWCRARLAAARERPASVRKMLR
jgi:hypothetical protein